MIKNIQAGEPLTTNIDPVEVAKSAAVGAVSGAVGGLTCGIATAAMGASGLGAAINAGIVSGVASGQAARATENVLNGQAITSGLGNPSDMVQDALLGGVTAAAGYGVGKMVESALAGRLQTITNSVNGELAANPALANTVLSGAEIAAGPKGLAAANYGKAVERLVAREVQNSSINRMLFEHVGGPNNPDFIGRGMNFDITTPAQRAAHLLRPYGNGLRVVTYQRNY